MIAIDQLLESVDLDFEPRWVTKDQGGWVTIWEEKPHCYSYSDSWQNDKSCNLNCGYIKLADFADKPWQECIYEVPRKTKGKIEKFELNDFVTVEGVNHSLSCVLDSKAISKLNELVDAANELKGAKNE